MIENIHAAGELKGMKQRHAALDPPRVLDGPGAGWAAATTMAGIRHGCRPLVCFRPLLERRLKEVLRPLNLV
jgi:hypothetical protein